MAQRLIASTLLLLISGCSNEQISYSPLSVQQQQKLHDFQMNNTFISGCVTERLQVINRNYCDQESHYCNIPPESSFSYQQWLDVYQSCTVKP